MKHLCLALFSSLFLFGCMDTGALDKSQNSAQSSIAETQASNKLFIDDVASSSGGAEDQTGEQDDSVKKDTAEARVKAMVEKLMDRLDADDSGSLSLEEFLKIAEPGQQSKRGRTPSAEKLAQRVEALKAEFAKQAGADNLLSVEEATALLKAQGPRVGRFRQAEHRGEHKQRVREISDELLKKFDTNGDGQLSEEEAQAIRAEDRENCRKGRDRDEDEAGNETDAPESQSQGRGQRQSQDMDAGQAEPESGKTRTENQTSAGSKG